MCSKSRHREYDEHLADCIQAAFVPLGDLNSAERTNVLEGFVASLIAEGITTGEELEGLVSTSKQPGVQKLLEAVYGKVRSFREADERLQLAAPKKKKADVQRRAAALKACREAYRTAAAMELFKCAVHHPEIKAAEKAPADAACGSDEEEEGEQQEAYCGIQADWFVGSSTDGVTIGGLWNHVQILNSQVHTLTSCTYWGGREPL